MLQCYSNYRIIYPFADGWAIPTSFPALLARLYYQGVGLLSESLRSTATQILELYGEPPGLGSVSPLTVFPLVGLGLGSGSLASPELHGCPSSPTPRASHLRRAQASSLSEDIYMQST